MRPPGSSLGKKDGEAELEEVKSGFGAIVLKSRASEEQRLPTGAIVITLLLSLFFLNFTAPVAAAFDF